MDRKTLEQNFKTKFEALNRVHLTHNEFLRLREDIIKPESLLIEINNFLLPGNPAKTASQAMKTLAETVSPPFLSKALNEYPINKDSDSFIYGFWVRLHPEGSHPGLSDEDDCTFRYHISIVFANYLLRRLKNR